MTKKARDERVRVFHDIIVRQREMFSHQSGIDDLPRAVDQTIGADEGARPQVKLRPAAARGRTASASLFLAFSERWSRRAGAGGLGASPCARRRRSGVQLRAARCSDEHGCGCWRVLRIDDRLFSLFSYVFPRLKCRQGKRIGLAVCKTLELCQPSPKKRDAAYHCWNKVPQPCSASASSPPASFLLSMRMSRSPQDWASKRTPTAPTRGRMTPRRRRRCGR